MRKALKYTFSPTSQFVGRVSGWFESEDKVIFFRNQYNERFFMLPFALFLTINGIACLMGLAVGWLL